MYSIIDFSTTRRLILNLKLGSYWAQCQIPARIKSVSVTLILMNPLTLVKVVFTIDSTLMISELNG